MRLPDRLKAAYRSLKLLKRADTAFTFASQEKDQLALQHIEATKAALGALSQYRFGIEPILLEIFLRGSLEGIAADDYEWMHLKEAILAASEYNAAEKIHLLVYLEELAATAGVTLPLSEIVEGSTPRQRVARHLIRRFPKLCDPS